MSKRDILSQGLANVRESMGDFGATHPPGASPARPPSPAPRPLPDHLIGVTRSKDVSRIDVDRIVRDPDQPREDFDPEALGRLAASMKARGQLQPIRVRWDAARSLYVVVVGERRWRAAKLAGLPSLACVVADGPMSPEERLAVQMVENAVREDLKPIEQANAYRRLMDASGWSTRQLAAELSISQGQVVRAVALLDLPAPVQDRVEAGRLSPAAAYEVSKIPDPAAQEEVARLAVDGDLTRKEVADVVQAVKARRPPGGDAGKPARREPVAFDYGGDGVVAVRWPRPGGLSAVRLLARALKEAKEAEAARDAKDGDGRAA